MESSILWQNDDQSVFLIDVPRSISLAQQYVKPRQLLSEAPLQTPYASLEPKSAKAKAKLALKSDDADVHTSYRTTLTAALQDIRGNYSGSYCYPRLFTTNSQPANRKRKLNDDTVSFPSTSRDEVHQTTADHVQLPDELFTNLTNKYFKQYYTTTTDPPSDFALTSNGKGTHVFLGDSTMPTSIRISEHKGGNENHVYDFHIPPRASFIVGDCANGRALREAVRHQHQLCKDSSDSAFDVILMDPPWPNSSVKRTHKTPGTTYKTSESMSEMRGLLLDSKVDLLLGEASYVGLWITNKPAVRELVLGEEGLFACWGVEVAEEWIWLKVTADGEPVCALDAMWRKPYEVLVWGRGRRKDAVQSGGDATSVRRRTLVAVPDVHSRKPCLKELLHMLHRGSTPARVLEVFARNLVSGWWSWGNECIKFNWGGYWRDESAENSTSSKVN